MQTIASTNIIQTYIIATTSASRQLRHGFRTMASIISKFSIALQTLNSNGLRGLTDINLPVSFTNTLTMLSITKSRDLGRIAFT